MNIKMGWIQRNGVPTGDRGPDGYVPHHLPGTNDQLKEFAGHFGLPFDATRGGKDSTVRYDHREEGIRWVIG